MTAAAASAPVAGWLPLLLAMLAVAIAALLLIAGLTLRRSRRPPPLPDAAAEPKAGALQTADRSASLAAEVAGGLRALKETVTGGDPRYRAPWVLLIGPRGSGKTSIADQLAGSAAPRAPIASAETEGAVRWRLLDQGVLIDVPGDWLALEGGPDSDKIWIRLLRLLVRHRSTQPVNGIVLAVSAADLLAFAADPENPAHAQQGAALGNQLRVLARELGVILPVFVLVTKCDAVRGFSAFCAQLDPSMEQDIFGWSNPLTLDAAFTPGWIDEAFELVRQTIARRQMQIFASRNRVLDPDDLFLFPSELQRLREPLRNWLWQVFRPSVYQDAHCLRGVYFCGRSASEAEGAARLIGSALPARVPGSRLLSGTARPGERRLVFLEHLFGFKVFLEGNLGRPIRRLFVSRNRTVLAAQALAALIFVSTGVGLTFAYRRLAEVRQTKFEPLVQQIASNLEESGGTSRLQVAYEMMDSLGYLDAKGFRSLWLPASWRDPIDDDIARLIQPAFQHVVLDAFKGGMEERLTRLTGYDPQSGQTACSQAPARLSRNAAWHQVLEQNPEYERLREFLADYTILDQNLSHYQALRARGGGNFQQLQSLMQYLSGRTLPSEYRYDNNPYYQSALQSASWADIDHLPEYRQASLCKARELVESFYDSWYRFNPLPDDAQETAQLLDRLSRQSTTGDLRSLVASVHTLETLLSGGSETWLRSRFDRAGFPVLQGPLRQPAFADAAFQQWVDSEGSAALSDFRGKLEFETKLAGPVLDTSGDTIRVAGPVLALAAQANLLAGLDFMVPGGGAGVDGAGTRGLLWNRDGLQNAAKLFSSFDGYASRDLPAVPPQVREPLRQIALQRLRQSVASAVADARLPIPPSDGSFDTSTAPEIRSFSQAQDTLAQIGSQLDRSGAYATESSLTRLLSAQAARLLRGVDLRLRAVSPYSPSENGFAAWTDHQPLSLALFGAGNAEDLRGYLNVQREQVRSLAASYAAPLVHYLTAPDVVAPPGTGVELSRWRSILGALEQYDAKKPGNSVAALETFISADLDHITPENRCQAAGDRRGGDFFLGMRNDLRGRAVRRCQELVGLRYTELADWFNQHLAGLFPFADLPASGGSAAEADPRDVAAFYGMFDPLAPALIEMLGQGNPYGASAGTAAAFLKQMAALKVLVTGTDQDAIPTVDFNVRFRTNRDRESGGQRIIDWELQAGQQTVEAHAPDSSGRWRFGDKVRLTLRYAKDSPYVPLVPRTEADGTVEDRSVVYEYDGAWALFALLRRHAAQPADFDRLSDPNPVTLCFGFSNIPDPAQQNGAARPPAGPTRVYLQLAILPPGKKEPVAPLPAPQFPTRAPKLAAPGGDQNP